MNYCHNDALVRAAHKAASVFVAFCDLHGMTKSVGRGPLPFYRWQLYRLGELAETLPYDGPLRGEYFRLLTAVRETVEAAKDVPTADMWYAIQPEGCSPLPPSKRLEIMRTDDGELHQRLVAAGDPPADRGAWAKTLGKTYSEW